jgi:HlyD family secretion protein
MSINKGTLDELRIDRNRAPRSLPWRGIGIAALVLVIGVVVCVFWSNRKAPALVRVATVLETSSNPNSQQTVLNASGYVTARRQATVSSKVTGQIIEVLFEEGQRVEAGQVLARVDSSNIKAGLQLAQAQAQSAKVAIEETQAQLAQSEKDLKRSLVLAEQQINSQSDVERAQLDVATLKARLARQQADVTVADKQVATWDRQLDDTVIRAPFTGVVISKAAQPGEMISPLSAGGAFTRTGICTLVDMASLEIEVDVNENYINRVVPGRRVEAALDAYVDWKIPGKVIAIIPTADRQKATVKVRVGFDQLDPRMLPDMSVKVSFQGADNAVATSKVNVPKAAIRKDDGRDIVFVLKDGRIERRAVTIGAESNGEFPILSNLVGGDKVIIEGPQDLKDGDPVKEKKT